MLRRLKPVYLRLRPVLPALLTLGLFSLALLALRALLHEIVWDDVMVQIHATPVRSLLAAGALTALSFVALAGYDLSGLRYLDIRLPLRTVALGSFAGYAIGNTVGLGALTGGAVRLRIYSAHGVKGLQIAQLMTFISLGFGLGITFIGALGLLWGADRVYDVIGIPALPLRLIGVVTLVSITAVIVLCASRHQPLIFKRKLSLPDGGLAATQVLVSALDILFAAGALWVLIPPTELPFMSFVAFYTIGISLGIILHIPGGVGVFEALIFLAYHDTLPTSVLAGSLVLFRVIYYLTPLAIALLLMLGNELFGRGEKTKTES